jgi:enoyl-CoA hydratase
VGLVHEVVTGDELLDRAVALAAGVAAPDPAAYALVKSQLHRPVGQAVDGVSNQDVVRAWTSPGTRDRLTAQVARLRRR